MACAHPAFAVSCGCSRSRSEASAGWAVLCYTILYYSIQIQKQYNTIQYNIDNTIQYNTILYYYCAVLCYTITLGAGCRVRHRAMPLHPISLLRLSKLLRFVDSKCPEKSLMEMRTPPLKLKIPLEPNPLKSRIFSSEIDRSPAKHGTRARARRWTPAGHARKR